MIMLTEREKIAHTWAIENEFQSVASRHAAVLAKCITKQNIISDDFGPYFYRDLCDVLGVERNTPLDYVMNIIKVLIQCSAMS